MNPTKKTQLEQQTNKQTKKTYIIERVPPHLTPPLIMSSFPLATFYKSFFFEPIFAAASSTPFGCLNKNCAILFLFKKEKPRQTITTVLEESEIKRQPGEKEKKKIPQAKANKMLNKGHNIDIEQEIWKNGEKRVETGEGRIVERRDLNRRRSEEGRALYLLPVNFWLNVV